MEDTNAHQSDNNDEVDKENEPPVTLSLPLESPNNSLVSPQVLDENLYKPISVVTRKSTHEERKEESFHR